MSAVLGRLSKRTLGVAGVARRSRISPGMGRRSWVRAVLACGILLSLVSSAWALIEGGEGNTPLRDPGWPKGAAAIFNHRGRVAWWEGPPFGGGQWHSECRGDAKDLTAVLAEFATLDVRAKRVVVHDGVGASFWLNPNNVPAKAKAAEIDWAFVVWQPDRWALQRTLPPDLDATGSADGSKGPPSQIDVYTGGRIRWDDVKVPEGLEVLDQRLAAHGFTLADGRVLEGRAVDLATGKPLPVRIHLQKVEPQAKGGYQYSNAAETRADAEGHWVLKQTPAGWYRLVLEADGYVPRIVGYVQPDGQPAWSSHDSGLSRPATVSGKVTDEAGMPVADAEVRLQDVVVDPGGRYESPQEYVTKSREDGRFTLANVPISDARLWVRKAGYFRPGLGQLVAAPGNDVSVQIFVASAIRVVVDFRDKQRPGAYLVQMEPEGGEQVGKWSGSGMIDAKDQITFENVPPGRYVVFGQPNPGAESSRTAPQTVTLKAGETAELTIVPR